MSFPHVFSGHPLLRPLLDARSEYSPKRQAEYDIIAKYRNFEKLSGNEFLDNVALICYYHYADVPAIAKLRQ